MPSPGPRSELPAISCTASTARTAVGHRYPDPSNAFASERFAERWNGWMWSLQRISNAGPYAEMSLRVHVDVGHRPELNTDELWQIVQNGLGDQHEIVKQGRWYQVPNVIVKRSDSDGAAIQILQQRLPHRTVLRVYGVAPSVAKRPSTPYGMRRQITRSQPLVDEVVTFLRGCSALGPRHRSGVEQVRELRGFACRGCDQYVVAQECLDLDFEAILLMAFRPGRGLV